MKKHTLRSAWAKAGLEPFRPSVVLERMELMEGRCALNLDRPTPPPPDENVPIN
jgi:hypothetical protein